MCLSLIGGIKAYLQDANSGLATWASITSEGQLI